MKNEANNLISRYHQFIEAKRHSEINYGINPKFIPNGVFDFQEHIINYATKKGRCAVFVDTGLGKTIIEISVATNYFLVTNKPVLILTPLAVAFQFLKEAEKFGIGDIQYSKDGKFTSKIVVTNYERLHNFSPFDFGCVILDESSILKNFDGAIKNQVTAFMKKVKYRFLFTATPSPNDYIELGTSSEALGYMGYMDMLTKFFKNNNATIKQSGHARAGEKWYLKPHAEKDFWRWVASWSISMRKPSDIGFDDSRHILPELHEIETVVKNNDPLAINGQMQMFNFPAVSFQEIKSEVRSTVFGRCEKAVELSIPHECSVYWVNLNDEADAIIEMDKSAVEVRGNMDLDKKEDILLAFSEGQIKKLVTKTSITAFGLNWQHCNHTTYFPTYSYEQYYQAIRRFWRFGQVRPVFVDLVISDGQTRIMQSISAKKDKAITMFEQLARQTNSKYDPGKKGFDQQIILPSFI